MSNEIRLFRFAPDAPGKGGETSGLTSFLSIEDTRQVKGFRPYRRMWKRDRKCTVLYHNNLPGRRILGFLDWYLYLGTAASPVNFPVFADGYIDAGNAAVIGIRLFDDTDVYWESVVNSELTPVSFVPVNNRLFMSTGLGVPRVWGGTFSGGAPNKVWKLGVPSPTVAPTLNVSYSFTSPGTVYYAVAGSYTIQYPLLTSDVNYDNLVPNETVRLTHPTLANPDYKQYKVVSRVSGTTLAASPHVGPHKMAANGDTQARITNPATGGGSNTTWLVDKPFPADGNNIATQFVGLYLKYLGNPYLITNAVNNGDGSTTLTTATAGPGGVVNAGFQIEGVRVELDGIVPGGNTSSAAAAKITRPEPGVGYSSWTGAEAPGYAYAYYDPVSGHISNLSPITYVEPTDVINGKIEFDVAPQEICANGGTMTIVTPSATGIQYVDPGGGSGGEYSARFTKILWFRTRRSGGGAVLYPLGSLDTTSANWHGMTGIATGAMDLTWVDDLPDDQLLVSGRLRAPLLTNHQPRIVSHTGVVGAIKPHGMAWWDGRLWLFGPPDMAALHYSCDAAQCGMGRPEESFPDGNRLVIPASSGEITSILAVGEYLLVNTRLDSYIVMGNHETNYRLIRISTDLGGVKATDLCEIPLGGGQQGVVAAVTSDKRVLLVTIGGDAEDIGMPIMNYLGGPVRGVAYYRADGHPRLAIAVDSTPLGAGGVGRVFEYNFDHKVWTHNPPEVTLEEPFENVEFLASVRRTAASQTWPAADQTESFLVFGVLGNMVVSSKTATTGTSRALIETWPLPGTPGKRRYSFVWARVVYVGGASGTVAPTLTVTPNQKHLAPFVYTMADHTDPARKLWSQADTFDGDSREFVCFAAAGSVSGTPNPARPMGYSLSFSLSISASDSVLYTIPYIEIALREETEDGGIDP